MKHKVFHKCWLATMGFIATLVIVFALALTVLRVVVPQVPEYKAELEKWISESVGQPIRIADLAAEMEGIYLTIRLKDAEIVDSTGKYLLFEMQELRVSINLISSIWEMATQGKVPRPSVVELVGIDLALELTPNGKLEIQGLPALANTGGPKKSAQETLAALPDNVRIVDSRLLFRDRQLNQTFHATRINVALKKRNDRLAIGAALNLPSELGDRMRLLLEMRLDTLDNPQFDLYVQGAGLLVHQWPWLKSLGEVPLIVSGEHDVQVWGFWNGVTLESTEVRFASRDLSVRPLGHKDDTDNLNFHRLEAEVAYSKDENGWRVDLGNLKFEREAGQTWQTQRLAVWEKLSNNGKHLGFNFDFLRLEDVLAAAKIVPSVAEALKESYGKLGIEGDFADGYFGLQFVDDKVADYQFDVRVDRLAYGVGAKSLRVEKVGARLKGNQDHGVVLLGGHGGEILLGNLFREPIPITSLTGEIAWEIVDGQWRAEGSNIKLSNSDLSAEARFQLASIPGQKKPFLDLQAHVQDAVAGSTFRYLPAAVMDPHAVAWLDAAFSGGRVKSADVMYYGALGDFPYDTPKGIFKVVGDFENVQLAYHPDWPSLGSVQGRLTFEGRKMMIEATGGSANGVPLNRVVASIDNLVRPVLEVEGYASGSARNMYEFLGQTPLPVAQSDTLKAMSIDGPADFYLSFGLPLVRNTGKNFAVNGWLDFKGARYQLPQWGVDLTDLRGRLAFSDKGIESKELVGQLVGVPIKLAVVPSGSSTQIDVEGRINPLRVLGVSWEPVAKRFEGDSLWQLKFLVPTSDNNLKNEPLKILAKSDLLGTRVNLPAPFTSEFEETKPLLFELELDKKDTLTLALDYGKSVSAVLQFDRGDALALSRGTVLLNAGKARLFPAKGLKASGQLNTLNFDAWREVIDSIKVGGASKQQTFSISDINVLVGRLTFLEREFANMRIQAVDAQEGWRVQLTHPRLQGRFEIPYRFDREHVIKANFDKLYVERKPNEDSALLTSEEIDPKALPGLDVVINDFRLDNAEFGRARFVATPIKSGLQVDKFDLDGPTLLLRANGSWLSKTTGGTRTLFQSTFNSPDLGGLLESLGMADVMRRGHATGTFELGWDGGPKEFAFAKLNGNLAVEVEDGSFPKVEPGAAGRFMGLFSISALASRLTLDFRDLFGEGFAFERMGGRVKFADGSAYPEDFSVNGKLADVRVEGKIGIAEKNYDQIVTVTPKVSNSIPLVGGLAAGTQVGVALLIAQKLFKKQLNQMTRFKYKVTGSWDDPKLERIKDPNEQPDEVYDSTKEFLGEE